MKLKVRAKKTTVEEKRELIKRLRQEIADANSPFKVGDVIRKEDGYQAGTYKVIEVLPCDNDEGYRLLGRKYSDVYKNTLTLLFRDLCYDLDGYRKVG